MIDASILPLQRRVLAAPAKWLVKAGVRADQITIIGCLIGVLAAVAAGFGLYGLALLGLAFNRVADGLDGAVARLTEPTDRGAFLDIALDYVFYVSFPLGLILSNPDANALPGALLVGSFVLSGTSFLAFSVIAAKRGLKAEDYPSKGIYYLGGLTEGFETIAVFILFCLFPSAFPILAMVFAAACTITGLTRYMAGWAAF
ncbi:MAG: CDP-alcohol phosphatidyltransferase family protein, partial [Pseudomonadota bacterium]